MFENYPDILTVEEMCEVLHIGKNYAYEMINRGEVSAFRCGRIWKIPKEGIIQFVLRQSRLKMK